jgi:exonuclease 3'-5' domain-containing protein 2
MEGRYVKPFVISAFAIATIVFLRKRYSRSRCVTNSKTEKNSEEDDDELHDFDLPPHLVREMSKELRRKQKIPLFTMKSPMYDNIFMIDPQGSVLSTISNKKAAWYVSRGLASWTNDTCIQLKFEPRGKSSGQDVYSTSPKLNQCVVCGKKGSLMRHYIVPYAYRALLPEKYKSHQSHDIVILCPKCNLHCEKYYHIYRKELEDGLRKDPNTVSLTFVDPKKQQVRSAGLALLRWKEKIPRERLDQYDKIVREHLGLEHTMPLTIEQLQCAIDVTYRIPNEKYISGARIVVDHLMEGGHDRITEFIKQWRQFFIHSLRPTHLPTGWNVDAPVACENHKVKGQKND